MNYSLDFFREQMTLKVMFAKSSRNILHKKKTIAALKFHEGATAQTPPPPPQSPVRQCVL